MAEHLIDLIIPFGCGVLMPVLIVWIDKMLI